MGISLGTLAGLPPFPLFASEVLIVAGGFAAGRPWTAGASAVLLALGFLGLAHALIDTTVGKARRRDRALATGIGQVRVLAGIAVVCLLGLTAAAIWLPGSAIAHALMQGIG
jgi:hydrogenase-4 component F